MADHPDLLDCAIIGAGAAGLSAAVYLARFKRRIAVMDAGCSRLLTIPTSHNYPGFAGGIHGGDILQRLREQAVHYQACIASGTVQHLERLADGRFLVAGDHRQWHARTVILATGVVDIAPDFPDVKRAVLQGGVRYCPVCDGLEASDKKVAVVGRGKNGLGEALFINHFTADVSLFALDQPLPFSTEECQRLARSTVRAVSAPVRGLACDERGKMTVFLRDGSQEHFDVLYAALGTLVNAGLARALGASCADSGQLIVDAHQQTTVDGLYAAGDVVAGLNQITVAMGHAAIAATAVHNRLREQHA